jgi:hypothetical protein
MLENIGLFPVFCKQLFPITMDIHILYTIIWYSLIQ